MRTDQYSEVIQSVAVRSARQTYVTDHALINECVNTAYKFAWEHYDWPETLLLEERTPVDQLIAWDQAGESVIGSVLEIYESDPTLPDARARKLYWGQGSDGAWVKGTYTTVFVLFQRPAPRFTSTAYSGGTAYVAGNLVFDSTTGECYKALAASTGVPVTDTTKWEAQPLLRLLREAVIAGAVALLRQDAGQAGASALLMAAMQDALEHEVFLLDTRSNRKRRVRLG